MRRWAYVRQHRWCFQWVGSGWHQQKWPQLQNLSTPFWALRLLAWSCTPSSLVCMGSELQPGEQSSAKRKMGFVGHITSPAKEHQHWQTFETGNFHARMQPSAVLHWHTVMQPVLVSHSRTGFFACLGGLILGVTFPVCSKGYKTYNIKPLLCTQHLVETADSLKGGGFFVSIRFFLKGHGSVKTS